jgi:murein DD-endopeptidase MepM/ murein hydrolase activator NlpD
MSRRARALVALAVLLTLVAGSAPALSVTEEDVEQARREREEAASARAAAIDSVAEAVAAYEEIDAEYKALVHQIGVVRSRIDAYEDEVLVLRQRIRERAADAYMRGIERDPTADFFAEGIQYTIVAQEVLTKALTDDVAALDSLDVITGEMDRLRTQLADDSERANDLRFEAEVIADRMYQLLAEAEESLVAAQGNLVQVEEARAEQLRQEELERIRREEERRRQELAALALRGPGAGVPDEVTPGFICPVQGISAFADTWGAPRSGGRVHVGVDMMAPRGTPLVAVADGVVTSGYGALAGNLVYLDADYGARFFYAHLDAYPANFVSGSWVPRGTVIGYMGDTGNPKPGAYHLHFSIYPTGSGAVNPYPSVARHCPRP